MYKNITYSSSLLLMFFWGCSDGSQTFVYDKKILHTEIQCLSLTVVPPNKEIEDTLNTLYTFTKECAYNFEVSYKTSITCNSNQNADKKAHGLPKSYLRMEIKKDGLLKYTYYKDLRNNLESEDVQDGFEIIKENLHL